MKTVCICTSFKFYDEALKIQELFEDEGIKCLIPAIDSKFRKPENPAEYVVGFAEAPDEAKLVDAKRMVLDHFDKIDASDIVYILAKNGYIGKSVCHEIGYSWKAGKPMYCSEKLDGYSQMSLTEGVKSPEEMVSLIKSL